MVFLRRDMTDCEHFVAINILLHEKFAPFFFMPALNSTTAKLSSLKSLLFRGKGRR
jgi:hypothetical protein